MDAAQHLPAAEKHSLESRGEEQLPCTAITSQHRLVPTPGVTSDTASTSASALCMMRPPNLSPPHPPTLRKSTHPTPSFCIPTTPSHPTSTVHFFELSIPVSMVSVSILRKRHMYAMCHCDRLDAESGRQHQARVCRHAVDRVARGAGGGCGSR